MPDGTFIEYSYVCGPASDIHEDHAELTFVRGKDGCRRSDLLKHDILEPEAGLLGTFGDIAHR